MATITIASANVPNWQRDADVELRVYAEQSFTESAGALIVGNPLSEDQSASNNWFARATCTLSGTTLTVASLQLFSTTDSDNPAATYAAAFFTTEGQKIASFGEFDSFVVPPIPASTTWKDLAAYNRGIVG